MPNNGKPQSVTNIFSQQSNGVGAETLDASVRQDKTAHTRGRAGTDQPEPLQKAAQSRATNNKPQRSKKHGSSRRKTVHLVLWVKPIVKAELQRIAEQEGLSMSGAGGALLARALEQNIDMKYHALLEPVITSAIRKEIHSYSNRIAILLARSVFTSEQTRSLTTNILGRQQGVTEDLLKNILAMSQRAAKANITRRTPQLTDLINAIEQWLLTDDETKEPPN